MAFEDGRADMKEWKLTHGRQPEDVFTLDLLEGHIPEDEAPAGTEFDISAENSAPVDFQEHPRGTWENECEDTGAFIVALHKAVRTLESTPVPFQDLYIRAIQEALAQHRKMLKELGSNKYNTHRWRKSGFQVSAKELRKFGNYCSIAAAKETAPIQFKVRRGGSYYMADGRDQVRVGMFVPGVGSIEAYSHTKSDLRIEYFPYLTTFFLDSYVDMVTYEYAPESLWDKTYCADKLAMSDTKIATVKTFKFKGKEYINTGGCGSRDFTQCNGWEIRELEKWNGPTYNYRSHIQAYDDGRVERGDHRGLVVHVKRKPYVLVSPVWFYDDRRSEREAKKTSQEIDLTPIEYESEELLDKWGHARVVVRLLPSWDANKGIWTVGWFCFVGTAVDEWVPGMGVAPNWPWYRTDVQPSSTAYATACGSAARAVKIVIEQMLSYVDPECAQAARRIEERLEEQARRWFLREDTGRPDTTPKNEEGNA